MDCISHIVLVDCTGVFLKNLPRQVMIFKIRLDQGVSKLIEDVNEY